MTPETLESLMAEIEEEDPLDFGQLPAGEADTRRLMATHFCELDQRLASAGLSAQERLELLMAIAAHTMLENMLLQYERLAGRPADAEFKAWMQRHGLG